MSADERVERVVEALDRLNGEDPNVERLENFEYPRELIFSKRVSDWIHRLRPDPPEALRIAARGHHVRRWTVSRSGYPEGRGGYLRWREDLKKMHAEVVAAAMRDAGYAAADIEDVRGLVMKKNIKTDDRVQALEDALCLVFLEYQFADLRAKTPADKMREIVRKTWAKMSERGREMALGLPLSEEDKAFLKDALS